VLAAFTQQAVGVNLGILLHLALEYGTPEVRGITPGQPATRFATGTPETRWLVGAATDRSPT
jgi:hypothetical protein